MLGYAVIDTETTGLNKMGNDRIAEIAVATFDTNFNLTGQYETLLNPQRDLGLTSLHGITGLMALEAPKFPVISASLGSLLHDRIIVGHNVGFDLRFVASEYLRTGNDICWSDSHLDTLKLAKRLNLPTENYKLGTLCEYFGIDLTEAHTAMGDVMATAELFQRLIRLNNGHIPYATPLRVPTKRTSDYRHWVPRNIVHEKLNSPYDFAGFLNSLPFRESELSSSAITTYLSTIHLALINGSYTYRERLRIEEVTSNLALSKNQVIDLNEEYLFFLICKNLNENAGRWCAKSSAEMRTTVEFTGIKEPRVQELISETIQEQLIPVGLQKLNSLFTLSADDGIVLTGEDFQYGRSYWESKLTQAGLVIKKSTSKRGSKAVICNDPYALSRNASLAREHGIPILTEATLSKFLS